MKNQQVIEKASAMGTKQKYCILANEVTRRLYNTEYGEKEEAEEVLEKMTRQLKNSGWNRKESKEIIISGYRGWERRILRRKEEGGRVYRSAGNSLNTRARRKLTGKVDWFKNQNKRKRNDDEEGEEKAPKRKKGSEEEKEEDSRIVSVLFIPYTPGGELTRRLRAAEEDMARQTGIKIKIVEKAGTKLVDLLHKSDPWQGADCRRENCLLCRTKIATEKDERQDCTQRSIVYQTWCLNCEKTAREKILEEEKDEEKAKEKIKKIPLFKYIGETARSAYERGLEHLRDFQEMKLDSHMLKHFLEKHEEESMENIKFGMKITKSARSSFERQISESVQIQINNQDHIILNSKAEYNRCALPRLTAKIGNYTLDEVEEKKKKEKEEEKILASKVRNLKVTRSKSRREEHRECSNITHQPVS